MISVLKYALFFGLLAATAYSQKADLTCPMEEMNYTACAGNDVLLTCATTTPEVVWEIYNGAGILVDTYSANSTTNISAQQKGNVFTFEKTSENNSTVTFEAQYALNGYLVYCTDVDFMTNSSTNMTTTSNNTEYCPIKIPAIPSPPVNPTYSLQGSFVNISWTYAANPLDCVFMFTVIATADNGSVVTESVDSPMTSVLLNLAQDVEYTITVTAMSLNENVTSEEICIQLSSPSSVAGLMGRYREQQEDIYVSWKAPMYPNCKRPSVTTYNVTHNATDGSTGGSGNSGAPNIAWNETITLPANETSYVFDNIVFGNFYFVEVTPSNIFGAGDATVIFITATPTPTTPPSTPTSPTSATTSESPTSAGGLSGGAIAGIVIAIIVVVLVVIFIIMIIVYLMCCREDKKHYKHDDGTKL